MRDRSAHILELLCISALLLLYGVTTYALVTVGGAGYRRVMDKRDTNADLRVALSYVSTQVRQHDEAGGVLIRETPGGDMLVLRSADGDETYETRVYLYEGSLMEYLTPEDEPFLPEAGSRLVALDGFSLRYAGPADTGGQALSVSVWKGEGDDRRESSVTLWLHAAGQEVEG